MIIASLQKVSLIDYPKRICATIFTAGCNFRCRYCHNPELVKVAEDTPHLAEEEIIAFLKRRVSLLDGITITGGEPTLHNDLGEFCQQIKDLGFLVKLDTNGSHPKILKKLIEANLVDYIAMDIKAPPGRYGEITGVPLATETLTASVDLVKSFDKEYEFRTTVVAGELTTLDFHQIGALLEGARCHFLQRFVPSQALEASYLNRQAPRAAAMEAYQKIMLSYVENCQIR